METSSPTRLLLLVLSTFAVVASLLIAAAPAVDAQLRSVDCKKGTVCLYRTAWDNTAKAAYGGSDSNYSGNTFDGSSCDWYQKARGKCHLNNEVRQIFNNGKTHNTVHYIYPTWHPRFRHLHNCLFVPRGSNVNLTGTKFDNNLSAHHWTTKTASQTRCDTAADL